MSLVSIFRDGLRNVRLVVAYLRLRSLLLKVRGHHDYLASSPVDVGRVDQVRRSLLWCRDRVLDFPDDVRDVRDPALGVVNDVIRLAEKRLKEITTL